MTRLRAFLAAAFLLASGLVALVSAQWQSISLEPLSVGTQSRYAGFDADNGESPMRFIIVAKGFDRMYPANDLLALGLSTGTITIKVPFQASTPGPLSCAVTIGVSASSVAVDRTFSMPDDTTMETTFTVANFATTNPLPVNNAYFTIVCASDVASVFPNLPPPELLGTVSVSLTAGAYQVAFAALPLTTMPLSLRMSQLGIYTAVTPTINGHRTLRAFLGAVDAQDAYERFFTPTIAETENCLYTSPIELDASRALSSQGNYASRTAGALWIVECDLPSSAGDDFSLGYYARSNVEGLSIATTDTGNLQRGSTTSYSGALTELRLNSGLISASPLLVSEAAGTLSVRIVVNPGDVRSFELRFEPDLATLAQGGAVTCMTLNYDPISLAPVEATYSSGTYSVDNNHVSGSILALPRPVVCDFVPTDMSAVTAIAVTIGVSLDGSPPNKQLAASAHRSWTLAASPLPTALPAHLGGVMTGADGQRIEVYIFDAGSTTSPFTVSVASPPAFEQGSGTPTCQTHVYGGTADPTSFDDANTDRFSVTTGITAPTPASLAVLLCTFPSGAYVFLGSAAQFLSPYTFTLAGTDSTVFLDPPRPSVALNALPTGWSVTPGPTLQQVALSLMLPDRIATFLSTGPYSTGLTAVELRYTGADTPTDKVRLLFQGSPAFSEELSAGSWEDDSGTWVYSVPGAELPDFTTATVTSALTFVVTLATTEVYASSLENTFGVTLVGATSSNSVVLVDGYIVAKGALSDESLLPVPLAVGSLSIPATLLPVGTATPTLTLIVSAFDHVADLGLDITVRLPSLWASLETIRFNAQLAVYTLPAPSVDSYGTGVYATVLATETETTLTFSLPAQSTSGNWESRLTLTADLGALPTKPQETGCTAIVEITQSGGINTRAVAYMTPIADRRLRLLAPANYPYPGGLKSLRVADLLPGAGTPYRADLSGLTVAGTSFTLRSDNGLVPDFNVEVTSAFPNIEALADIFQQEFSLDAWMGAGRGYVAKIAVATTGDGIASPPFYFHTPTIAPCLDPIPPGEYYSQAGSEAAILSRNHGEVQSLLCLDGSRTGQIVCYGGEWRMVATCPEPGPSACDVTSGLPEHLNLHPSARVPKNTAVPGYLDKGVTYSGFTCAESHTPVIATQRAGAVTITCSAATGTITGGCSRTCPPLSGSVDLGGIPVIAPADPTTVPWGAYVVGEQTCPAQSALLMNTGTLQCDLGTLTITGTPARCSACTRDALDPRTVWQFVDSSQNDLFTVPVGAAATVSCGDHPQLPDAATMPEVTLECTASGFSPAPPDCRYTGCSLIADEETFAVTYSQDGEVNPTGDSTRLYPVNTVATRECRFFTQANPAGADTRTCSYDAGSGTYSWSAWTQGVTCEPDSVTHCTVAQSHLTSLNLQISNSPDNNSAGGTLYFSPNSELQLVCNAGFRFTTEPAQRWVACSSGPTDLSTFACEALTYCSVATLPKIANGACVSSIVIPQASPGTGYEYPTGHGVQCSCLPGGTPEQPGIVTQTCNPGSTMTSSPSNCVLAYCPPFKRDDYMLSITVAATNVAYNAESTDDNALGTVLLVACGQGTDYNLVGGTNSTVECTALGGWVTQFPDTDSLCVPAVCAPYSQAMLADANHAVHYFLSDGITAAIPNANGDYSPGVIARLGCSESGILEDPNGVQPQATCSGVGYEDDWSSTVLCRARVQCEAPTFLYAREIVPAGPVYEGAELFYSCVDKYEPRDGISRIECGSDAQFVLAPECTLQTGCRGVAAEPDPSYTVVYHDANSEEPLPGPVYSENVVAALRCLDDLSGAGSYPDSVTMVCQLDPQENYVWTPETPASLPDGPFTCIATDCPTISLAAAGDVVYDAKGKFDTGVATVQCGVPFGGATSTHTCTGNQWLPALDTTCAQIYCNAITTEAFQCTYSAQAIDGYYEPSVTAECSCNNDAGWWAYTASPTRTLTCGATMTAEWDNNSADETCKLAADCEQFRELTVDLVYAVNNAPFIPESRDLLPLGAVATRTCSSYPNRAADPDKPSMTTTCREYGWDDPEFEYVPLCTLRDECELPPQPNGEYSVSQVYQGGSVSITCGNGYEEEGAVREVECLAAGQLSGELGCVPQAHCFSFANTLVDGTERNIVVTYDPKSKSHLHGVGVTATVACAAGFSSLTPSGDPQVPDTFDAECLSDFTWATADPRVTSVTDFQCVETLCPSLVIDFGTVNSYEAPVKGLTSRASVTCIDSYTIAPSGSEMPVCQDDGTWSPQINCAPTITRCAPLAGAFHDVYTYNGAKVSPDSAGGFALTTVLTRKCLFPQEPVNPAIKSQTSTCSSATWSDFTPNPTALCQDIPSCDLTQVANGALSTLLAYRDDVVTVTCHTGFQPTSGVASATCLAAGELTTTLSCEPQTHCIPLVVPENGLFSIAYADANGGQVPPNSLLLPVGTVARTQCSTGLSGSGTNPNSIVFMCVQQAANRFEWTSDSSVQLSAYSCAASDCGSLIVDNGRSSYSVGRNIGDSVTVACNQHFEAVGGVTSSTCSSNGWSPLILCGETRCLPYNDDRLSCSYIQTEGTAVAPGVDRFEVDWTAACACAPTHYGPADMTPMQFKCTDQGTLPYNWVQQTADMEPCTPRVPCEAVSIEGGMEHTLVYSTQPGAGEVYPLGATATFACAYPAEAVNFNEPTYGLTCQSAGWSPIASIASDQLCAMLPECEVPVFEYGSAHPTNASRPRVYRDDTVSIDCHVFYVPAEAEVSTCIEGSNFSARVSCSPAKCPPIQVYGFTCEYDSGVESSAPERTVGTYARCSCADGFAGPAESTPVWLACAEDRDDMGDPVGDGDMVWKPEMDNVNLTPDQCASVTPCLESDLYVASTDSLYFFVDDTMMETAVPAANNSFVRGNVAQYICDHPYTAIDDDVARHILTCGDSGWVASDSAELPLCKPLPTCQLPTIANGIARSTDNENASFVYQDRYMIVICDLGYDLMGSEPQTVCQADGTFAAALECHIVGCENQNWVRYSCSYWHEGDDIPNTADKFPRGTSAICVCADQFFPVWPGDPAMDNSIIYDCVYERGVLGWLPVDGSRTYESRPCKSDVKCGAPPTIANGVSDYEDGITDTTAGNYVMYTCNEFYYVSSTTSVTKDIGCTPTGWQAAPTCAVCVDSTFCTVPGPIVTNTRFVPSMDLIEIVLNRDSVSKLGTLIPCASLFKQAANIGSGPVCTFDVNTIRVKLGTSFTATVAGPLENNALTLLQGIFRAVDMPDEPDMYNQEQTLIIQRNAAPTAPVVLIDAPSTVGSGSPFTLSSARSSGSGGLGFVYTWSILSVAGMTPGQLNDAQHTLQDLVDAQKKTPQSDAPITDNSPLYLPTITAPSGAFTAGYTYVFQLRVSAWYGLQATGTASVTIGVTNLPSISVLGGRAFRYSRARAVRLPTVLNYAAGSATNVSRQLTVSWTCVLPSSSEERPVFTFSEGVLQIQPYALTVGTVYTFRASVMQAGLLEGNSQDITVTPYTASVVARVVRLNYTHTSSEDLVLDGSPSRDRNMQTPNSSPGGWGLSYSWQCTFADTGLPCWVGAATDVKQTVVILPLVGRVLNVKLTVTKGSRTSSVTGSVTIAAPTGYDIKIMGIAVEKLPPQMAPRMHAVVTQTSGTPAATPPVIYWSCDTRNVNMNNANLRLTPTLTGESLAFKAGSLTPGIEYRFRASLFKSTVDLPTADELAALPLGGPLPRELVSQTLWFAINTPPRGGVCRLTTGAGEIIAGSPAQFYCSNWIDDDEDGPLRYTWLLETAVGQNAGTSSSSTLRVEVAPLTFSPTLTYTFAVAGTYALVASVQDVWGAPTETRMQVIVKVPDSGGSSAQQLLQAGRVQFTELISVGGVSQTVLNVLDALKGTDDVENNSVLRQELITLVSKNDTLKLLSSSQNSRADAVRALLGEQFEEEATDNGVVVQDESETAITLVSAICGNADELTADSRLAALRFQVSQSSVLALAGASATVGVGADTATALITTLNNLLASFRLEAGLVNPNTTLGPSAAATATAGYYVPDIRMPADGGSDAYDASGAPMTGQSSYDEEDNQDGSMPPWAPRSLWLTAAVYAAESALGVVGVIPTPPTPPMSRRRVRALPSAYDLEHPYSLLGAGPSDIDECGALIGEKRRRLLRRVRARRAAAAAGHALLSADEEDFRPLAGKEPAATDPESADNRALITALRAEAGAMVNMIPAQLGVLAANSLLQSVVGETANMQRIGSLQVISQAVSSASPPAVLNTQPFTGGVGAAFVRLPADFQGSITGGAPSSGVVNSVITIVSDTDLIAYAGRNDNEYLNGTATSPFVSLTFSRRDTHPTLKAVSHGLIVPLPSTLPFNTTAAAAPSFFTIYVPHTAPAMQSRVRCEFWDPDSAGSGGTWATSGCRLVATNTTMTTCECSHLTMFRAKFEFEDFLPTFNTLSADDFLALTPENIRKHPVPLIAIMCWLAITVAFQILAMRIDKDKDTKALTELQRQWEEGLATQETELEPANAVQDIEAPLLTRVKVKLIYSLRHDHAWASIFLREDANSFSSVGRSLTAFVIFLSSYFVNAMFFGTDQSGLAFITISLISAAILLPIGFLLQLVFYRTQRGRVKSMIYGYAEHLCMLRYSGEGLTEKYMLRAEHQLKWYTRCSAAVERIQLNEIARLAAWPVNYRGERIRVVDQRNETKLKLRLRTLVRIDFAPLMAWYQTRTLYERLPRGARIIAFVALFIWVLFCILMILVYGMQFDKYRANATLEWLQTSAVSNAFDIFVFRMFIITAKAMVAIFILSALFADHGLKENAADRELSTVRDIEHRMLREEVEAENAEDRRHGGQGLTEEELDALKRQRQSEHEAARRRAKYLRASDLRLDNATEAPNLSAEAVKQKRIADRRAAPSDLEISKLDFTTQDAKPRKGRKKAAAAAGGVEMSPLPRARRASAVLGLGTTPSRRTVPGGNTADEYTGYDGDGEDDEEEVYRRSISHMNLNLPPQAVPPSPSSAGGSEFAAALAAERAAAEARMAREDAAAAAEKAAADRAARDRAAADRAAALTPSRPSGVGMVPAYQRMSFSAGRTTHTVQKQLQLIIQQKAQHQQQQQQQMTAQRRAEALEASDAQAQAAAQAAVMAAARAHAQSQAQLAARAPAPSAPSPANLRPVIAPSYRLRTQFTDTDHLNLHLAQMQRDHDRKAATLAAAAERARAEAQAAAQAAQAEAFDAVQTGAFSAGHLAGGEEEEFAEDDIEQPPAPVEPEYGYAYALAAASRSPLPAVGRAVAPGAFGLSVDTGIAGGSFTGPLTNGDLASLPSLESTSIVRNGPGANTPAYGYGGSYAGSFAAHSHAGARFTLTSSDNATTPGSAQVQHLSPAGAAAVECYDNSAGGGSPESVTDKKHGTPQIKSGKRLKKGPKRQ